MNTVLRRCGLALAVAGILAAPAARAADPVALAVAQRGTTNGVGLALAKVAAETHDIDIRVTPYRSTGQAIPLVNDGSVALAVANAQELVLASEGKGAFKDKSMANLRLVGVALPFKMTFQVRKSKGYGSVADMKGARIPSDFSGTSAGEALAAAILAAGGLTFDDVVRVPVTTFGNMREEFLADRIDATIGVLGSGTVPDIDEKAGGTICVPVNTDEETAMKVREHLPVARTERVLPDDDLPCVESEIGVVAYDYYVYANADAPDEIVAAMARILAGERSRLTGAMAAFRFTPPERIAVPLSLPYHPAARAIYEELGVWPKS